MSVPNILPATCEAVLLKASQSSFKLFLACFLSGAFTALAFAPFSLWSALWLGLSVFYLIFQHVSSGKRAFLSGWSFGFGYFSAGLWWIANAMLVEGNPFIWVWPLAVAGLPMLLAFFPALACSLHKKLFKSDTPGWLYFLAFITFLSGAEWLRGHIFTGFPWNLYGYSWAGWLAMSQIAALGGAYFLSLLSLFWATLPGFLLSASPTRKTKAVIASVALISFTGAFIYGHNRLNQETAYNQSVSVAMVQPNIAQADKWNPEKIWSNLEKALNLSKAYAENSKPADGKSLIIIWPETALTERILNGPGVKETFQRLLDSYQEDNIYFITGYLRREQENGQKRYYNSLAVFDRKMTMIAVYDKSHLVPFGEYIPLQKYLPLAPFVQLDGFTAGAGKKAITLNSLPAFSPLICYEVIFPGAVTPKDAASPVKWLLNVTNDAWYGISPGPYQHLAQARFRAIEEGIPVSRVANTGITAMIDPLGRTLHNTSLFSDEALRSALPHPLENPPLYALWGDYMYGLCIAILSLIIAIHSFYRRKKRNIL